MKLGKLLALPLAALVLAACEENSYQGYQGEGVQWVKSVNGVTFAEVKEMARQQGKHIFIEVYTTWCGPCKSMDKKVFPQKEVGDYYNAGY